LPKEIGNLINLKELEIPPYIKVLPEEISNLKNLEYISNVESPYNTYQSLLLSNKQINQFKKNIEIGYLKTLQKSIEELQKENLDLDLERLQRWIRYGSDEDGRSYHDKYFGDEDDNTYLKDSPRIVLGKDSVTERIPSDLYNCTKIYALHISMERVEELSSEIGNLTNLRELHIYKCINLKKLPKELGNLTNLTSLQISSCYNLKELPKELGNLINLKDFWIDSCKHLSELPKELDNLSVSILKTNNDISAL